MNLSHFFIWAFELMFLFPYYCGGVYTCHSVCMEVWQLALTFHLVEVGLLALVFAWLHSLG